MSGMPQWETVERPDGSFEIRGAVEEDSAPGTAGLLVETGGPLLGTARVTERGWVAEAIDGRTYGPFTSLSEAAYPLAMAAEGQDARLLLGRPIPADGLGPRPVPPAARPRRSRRSDRVIAIALLAVAVAALVTDRKGPKKQ
jgi:hypothetical protein